MWRSWLAHQFWELGVVSSSLTIPNEKSCRQLCLFFSGGLMASWFLYILECSDHSYYTGITTDSDRRILEHNAGRGSAYVRSRLPAEKVFEIEMPGRSQALKAEYLIKAMSRSEKAGLIRLKKLPFSF